MWYSDVLRVHRVDMALYKYLACTAKDSRRDGATARLSYWTQQFTVHRKHVDSSDNMICKVVLPATRTPIPLNGTSYVRRRGSLTCRYGKHTGVPKAMSACWCLPLLTSMVVGQSYHGQGHCVHIIERVRASVCWE